MLLCVPKKTFMVSLKVRYPHIQWFMFIICIYIYIYYITITIFIVTIIITIITIYYILVLITIYYYMYTYIYMLFQLVHVSIQLLPAQNIAIRPRRESSAVEEKTPACST